MRSQNNVSPTILASLAVGAFLFLLLNMPRNLNIVDEGIILTDAMRVLHGEILHRDFYSNYGPGQYYVVAGIFWLFGEDFIFARVYDVAIRAAVVTTIFFIIDKQGSRVIALVFAAISLMWLTGHEFYLYPIFPCMLFTLIGSYLVASIGEEHIPQLKIFFAGVCTGATTLFRYEVGFLVLLAHLISFATLLLIWSPRGAFIRRIFITAALYGCGISLVFVPAAIAFLSVAPVETFIADIIEYPMRYYALMRSLPFPGFASVGASRAVYLPILAGGLACAELIRRALRNDASEANPSGLDRLGTVYLVVFGTTAVALFTKGIVRVSTIHMLLGIIPALVVFAVLIQSWWREGRLMRLGAVVGLMVTIYSPLKEAINSVRQNIAIGDRSMAGLLLQQIGMLSPDGRSNCDYAPYTGLAKLATDYARVANYLDTHSRSDERILAALDRHDKIFANPVGLYFASGRLPPTRWHQFDPGLVSRADIQAAIINDIIDKDVRWIVRDANFSDTTEPNGSARSSGVFLLDNYLESNYRPVAAGKKISIWLRNGEVPLALRPAMGCEVESMH